MKERYCKNCGIPLMKRTQLKFCSHHCSATYSNRSRIIKIKCLYCGKEINKKCIKKSRKFCNKNCESLYNNKQAIYKIEQLGILPSRQTLRKYLICKYNNTCSICNSKTWNNQPIHLIMDHIDGNPYNNTLENLRLICPNCDAQLPTYKGKNRGHGRFYRRQRYINGKSY